MFQDKINISFRPVICIATGLCLGEDNVKEHTCICGTLVDHTGHHGLSCRWSDARVHSNEGIML